MKRPLLFLFVCLLISFKSSAQFACAGLDRVDIYINQKLVATATPAVAPTLKLDSAVRPDTLTFHAFTNWEGLKNSTMDIKDADGELIDHINSNTTNGYEAVYTYVFDRSSIDDPDLSSIDIFINLLCERDVEPEQISTISLRRNAR